MKKILLTIFTPAYNRSSLLPRLFESICSQVGPDVPVEWLVIDDGSADDTVSTLTEFASRQPDLLRFLKTTNGGKHRAINRAAKMAKGDWVMIVDSDDVVRPGAIAEILKVISAVDSDQSIGVVRGLKLFPGINKPVGNFIIPKNPCHYFEWISHQASFDTSEVFRRKALLDYPFSEYEGEKFQAEDGLRLGVDKLYRTLFVNSFWEDCFYQDDGLSARSRIIRAESPRGAMDVYFKILQSNAVARIRLRAAVNWWCYFFHARKRRYPVVAEVNPWWILMFLPLGYGLYVKDRWAGL